MTKEEIIQQKNTELLKMKVEAEKKWIELDYYKSECKRLTVKETELKQDIHKLEKYICEQRKAK